MKIGLKIIAILAVIALIAGGIYLLVENTSIVSNIGRGERPEFTNGERPEMPEGGFPERGERPEGNHHNEASLTRGFSEIGQSLIKIGNITALVLGVQFLSKRAMRLGKPKTLPA